MRRLAASGVRALLLAAALGLAASCATPDSVPSGAGSGAEAAAQEPPRPERGPREEERAAPPRGAAPGLRQALGREAEPLPPVRVRAPDGSFEARVPARVVSPPEALEDRLVMRLDLGARSQVECSIFDEPLDLAAALDGISESLLSESGVEARRLHRIDAGAVDTTPYLGLDWVYRARAGGRVTVSLLKQRAATVADHTFYCLHDELGYEESFERVFRGLVASADFPGREAPVIYYREVSVASVGRLTLGFASLRLGRDAEGSVRAEGRLSTLMPTGPGNVVSQDRIEVAVVSEEGALLREAVGESRDAQPVTQLVLEPAGPEAAAAEGGGTWIVQGVHEGEPVDARFTSEERLLAPPGEYRVVRETIASGERDVRYATWAPDVDPTGVAEIAVEVVGRRDDGAAEGVVRIVPRDGGEDASELRMQVILDPETGAPLRSDLAAGVTTLRLERIAVHGRP